MRFAEAYVRHGKKATNVSINEGLLREAKALDINLSATLEDALAVQVRAKQRAQWLADNREAIQNYNAFVAEHGVFSPTFRKP